MSTNVRREDEWQVVRRRYRLFDEDVDNLRLAPAASTQNYTDAATSWARLPTKAFRRWAGSAGPPLTSASNAITACKS
jgi:hypothetical protein